MATTTKDNPIQRNVPAITFLVFLFSIDLILKIRVFNWLLSSPNAAHRYAPFANGDIPISQIVVKYLFLLFIIVIDSKSQYVSFQLSTSISNCFTNGFHQWMTLTSPHNCFHKISLCLQWINSWMHIIFNSSLLYSLSGSKIIGFRDPQIIGTANPYTVLISTFLRTPTSSFHWFLQSKIDLLHTHAFFRNWFICAWIRIVFSIAFKNPIVQMIPTTKNTHPTNGDSANIV